MATQEMDPFTRRKKGGGVSAHQEELAARFKQRRNLINAHTATAIEQRESNTSVQPDWDEYVKDALDGERDASRRVRRVRFSEEYAFGSDDGGLDAKGVIEKATEAGIVTPASIDIAKAIFRRMDSANRGLVTRVQLARRLSTDGEYVHPQELVAVFRDYHADELDFDHFLVLLIENPSIAERLTRGRRPVVLKQTRPKAQASDWMVLCQADEYVSSCIGCLSLVSRSQLDAPRSEPPSADSNFSWSARLLTFFSCSSDEDRSLDAAPVKRKQLPRQLRKIKKGPSRLQAVAQHRSPPNSPRSSPDDRRRLPKEMSRSSARQVDASSQDDDTASDLHTTFTDIFISNNNGDVSKSTRADFETPSRDGTRSLPA